MISIDSRYSIDEYGNVFDGKFGRLVKNQNHEGYLRSAIHGKDFLNHRLVAKEWCPNPDSKPEVNHKDGIKSNNYYKNLEWSTRSENVQHSFDTGLKNGNNGICLKPHLCEMFSLYNSGSTMKSLADKYGVSDATIARIINGAIGKYKNDLIKTFTYDRTQWKGEKNITSKLTDNQVRDIINLKGKLSHSQIGKLYGVSKTTIGYILRGKTWTHLTNF